MELNFHDYEEEIKKIVFLKQYKIDNDVLNNKEILLYGAGDLGHLAITLLREYGLEPKYIVDRNAGKVNELDGIPVISLTQVSEVDKLSSLFLITICTVPYQPIYNLLKDSGINNVIQFYSYAYLKFPNLISNGYLFDVANNETSVKEVCRLLSHDEISLKHYLTFLYWKTANMEHIFDDAPILSGKKYFGAPCIPGASEAEVMIDCGSYHGQAIEKFIHYTNDKYKEIIAIEPDEESLLVCKKNFADSRIKYYNSAVSNFCGKAKFKSKLGYSSKLDENAFETKDVITIDSINAVPTFIKLHIEGAELKALQGAHETIKKYKPTVMCLADHNDDGVCKIPLLLAEYGYKVYFYLHDYCGNTAVWYGVKK